MCEEHGEVRDRFRLGCEWKVVMSSREDFCFAFGTLGLPLPGEGASWEG